VPASIDQPGDVPLQADARLVVGPVEDALGLRLMSGRFLDIEDSQDRPHVVMVDRRFVEQWLPGADPLQVKLRLQIDPAIEWQIVGVIDDARWRSFEAGTAPTVLIPAAQFANVAPMRNAQLVVHARPGWADRADALPDALRRGMPLLSADAPQPLTAIVATSSAQARLASRLLGLLCAMALLLALLGVGALLLYRHERQRQAIGIRICLGATRARVVVGALADTVVLSAIGSAVGAVLLFGAQQEPEAAKLLGESGLSWALSLAATTVAGLTLLGSALPAWRSAHLEPREVLGMNT
jgi:hypothetical protein